MSGGEGQVSALDAKEAAFAGGTKGNLAHRSVRGGITTLATQGVKFGLNLASTVILARLLVPDDFGLFAMVMPIVGLISLFQDFGLSAATVQRKEVSPAQVSALFWMNMAFGAVLAVLTAALGPVMAWFYDEPRVLGMMYAFAALMLFSGFTAQHIAMFQRQMRFKRLAVIELISIVASYCVGVIGAWMGLAYWSLVLMIAGKTLTQVVFIAATAEWWPSRPARVAGVRAMISFGRSLTLVNVGFYLTRNLDNVLIGRVWGEQMLGFYSKAYGLLLLPLTQINGPVGSVAIPVLSRLQSEPDRYRAYYVKGISILVGITMPMATFMAADAEVLIRIVLGEQWLAAIPIFQALAPAALMSTFSGATAWVFISLGMPDRQLRWVVFAHSPVVILSFFIGLPFGAVGVATAYSIAVTALRLPAVIYCFRGTPLRLSDLGRALLPSTIASLVAGGAVLGLEPHVAAYALPILAHAALDAATFGAVYAAVYCLLPIGRRNVRVILDLLRTSLLPNASARSLPA